MKYIIKAKIEVDGVVDKPDIIGAIFGQTEGIFGTEFDLRDLQEKGRIGRIYVESKTSGGKTIGEIYVPSNLDKSETALLAAMIESVEKVGPYNAKIVVTDLVDLRVEKMRKIVERAKEILSKWGRERTPDLKEILSEINSVLKIASITTYGPERLPAGPEVASSDTIIIVEGRADVLNLLRAGYKNVIAIEGAHSKVPDTLKKLAQKKTVIAFVDGDRAGDMILRTLLDNGVKIDYVAKAPSGREVEELSIREVEKALKNMVPISEYLKQLEKKKVPEAIPLEKEEIKIEQPMQILKEEVKPQASTESRPTEEIRREVSEETYLETAPSAQPEEQTQEVLEEPLHKQPPTEVVKAEVESSALPKLIEIPESVMQDMKDMIGTLTSAVYDQNWGIIKKLSVRDLFEYLEKNEEDKNIYAIILDGIVTQRLVNLALRKGVKVIIGYRLGSQVSREINDLRIYLFDDIIPKTSSQ
ncbi:MAG: DNA primase DnaG [Sulfolobales archaeon]